MPKQRTPISEALATYDRQEPRADLDLAERERQAFLRRWPLDSWLTMSLQQYALGQPESSDTFCYWLEFKTADLVGMGGATSRKFLIYKHRQKPGWYFDSRTYENEQQAWEAVRGAFLRAFELARAGDWEEIDGLQPLAGARMLRLKALHLYFPDDLLAICSTYHLQYWLQQLGVPSDEVKALDAVGLNRRLLKELRAFPEVQGWTTNEMATFLYRWADPRETRRIVKIAPGDDAKYWQDCLEQGYICVGWDDIGDLRQFESEEVFREAFTKAFLAGYRGHLPTVTRKAREVWTLAQLEPGDMVVANKGTSKILGLGKVVDPGYEWRPERPEYRHTVRVEWDTSYARDIEPVKQWALVTVAAVSAELYQRILGPKVPTDSGKLLPVPQLLLDIQEALQRRGQAILYGPPGTGKTYQALRFAIWWLLHRAGDPGAPRVLVDKAAFMTAEHKLTTAQVARRVWWVVANPKEWSWDQLVREKRVTFRLGRLQRNYPLVQSGDLVLGYQSTPGKRIAALARVSKGLHAPSGENPRIELEAIQAIADGLTYAELQGDSVLRTAEPLRFRCQGTLFALSPDEADYLLSLLTERNADLAAYTTAQETIGPLTRVTFHASYSYEDWIEGFRPVDTGAGGLVLRLEDGLFKRVCREAQTHPNRTYLLVVDEINRANVTKVLGELITLLEKDKRGLSITLPQSKESFAIPENVYILGTMNTADRSIRLLDTALRRRFAFIELMPDTQLLQGAVINDLHLDDFLETLNRRIVAREGREKQIGHAFLLDGADAVSDPLEFTRRFRQEILPLLQEYCCDDYDALQAYLGRELVDAQARRLTSDVLEDPDRLLEALAKLVSSEADSP